MKSQFRPFYVPLGALLIPSALGVGVCLSLSKPTPANAQPAKRSVTPPPAPAPALPALGVDLAPDPFTPSVKVFVKNRGKDPITSRIVLSNPDNFLGASRSIQTVEVPASGETQAKFSLPGAAMAPDSRYSFTAEVQAKPGPAMTTTRLLSFFRIERAMVPPTMDGTMENWLNASMILVNIPGRPAGGGGWKGRNDMTATARFLWDANNLYVMVRRTDDAPVVADKATDTKGDRVRIALSTTGSHLSTAPWVLVDLIPLPDRVAVVRSSASALKLKYGGIPGAKASVSDQNGVAVYVASLPWKELGIAQGVKTKRLGITIRSVDDDGSGPKSWLEWGGGAGNTPDPPSFSDVSLGD